MTNGETRQNDWVCDFLRNCGLAGPKKTTENSDCDQVCLLGSPLTSFVYLSFPYHVSRSRSSITGLLSLLVFHLYIWNVLWHFSDPSFYFCSWDFLILDQELRKNCEVFFRNTKCCNYFYGKSSLLVFRRMDSDVFGVCRGFVWTTDHSCCILGLIYRAVHRSCQCSRDRVPENSDLLITVVIWNTHGRLLTIAAW